MKASQRKRLKTLRKHRKQHKRMAAKIAKQPTQTTAIVTVEKPDMLATSPSVRSMVSMVRKVQETVTDLERVRRFVSTCLNVDMQKWERKHPYPEAGTNEQIEEWDEERRALQVDWGTIPGVDKPFLMQPGAEKFMFWLELRPHYVNREVELGEHHLEIISHVIFYHKRTKEEVFEGPDCSCTTLEDNFRYMWAERKDPCTCQNKWECTKAEGLCDGGRYKQRQKDVKMGKSMKVNRYRGGKFIGKEWAWFERIEIPNISGKRNNVRQIGQKRALVKGVRGMGAISEIFTQPPDEWDIPEEREDTPETEMDYTEGGRRIYVDGKSPSGKHIDPKTQGYERPVRRQTLSEQQIAALKAEGAWCEKHQCDIALCPSEDHSREENEAACKIIEKRKSSANAGTKGAAASRQPQVSTAPPVNSSPEPAGGAPTYLGTIFVDFSLDAGTPVVRGDLSNLTENLEKHCGAVWHDGWWRIPTKHVETVAAMAKQLNYKFEIIQKSSAASAEDSRSTPRGGPPPPPAATKKRGPRKGTPGEHTIQGVIEKAIPHEGASPRVDFLVKTDKGTFWMGCYSKTWFGILGKEKYPCPVTLVVKTTINETRGKTYRNILRVIKIRDVEYDENAKRVIQQRTREAGGPTLFP